MADCRAPGTTVSGGLSTGGAEVKNQMNQRRKTRKAVSAKARRDRIRKLKAKSAYPVGHEVGWIEVDMDGTQIITVYRVAVHPSGRKLIWKRDRSIPVVVHWEFAQSREAAINANGFEMMPGKSGGPVPTKEEQVLKMLKEMS